MHNHMVFCIRLDFICSYVYALEVTIAVIAFMWIYSDLLK